MSTRQASQVLGLSETTNKVIPVKIGGTVPRNEGLGVTLVDTDPLISCVDTLNNRLKVDIEDATISGTGLATEPKQDDMISLLQGQTPALNRTKAIPVQIMVGDAGANYDALRANGQDLLVMVDDMNPDVAVNSGLARSLYQTDGSQKSQAWGTDGATQYQLKTDGDGHLQVDVLTAPTTTVSGTVAVSGGSITETNSTAILADTDILSGTAYADGDAVGAADKGILVMGRNGSNTAKPIHITNNGDVEVEIADFVKGQALMAASFPVVIASNQSAVTVDGSGVTQPISASSLPLPSGAATETTLNNAEVHLGNIDTKLPTAVDADRLKTARLFAWDTSTALATTTLASSGGNTTSSVIDLSTNGDESVQLFVSCSSAGTVTVEIAPQFSPDNSNWYDSPTGFEVTSATTHLLLENPARYFRLSVTNTDVSDNVDVSIVVGQWS